MKKAIIILMISAGSHYGCTDHGPVTSEPEASIPAIGYMRIDSVLAYNRHVPIYLDGDSAPDLYFTSMLVMEKDESCLYLQAHSAAGTGTRVLVAKNPYLVSNGRWAYPLAKGAVISDKTDASATWAEPGQNAALLRIVQNKKTGELTGPWREEGHHYVGFRKISNGHEQFGWVRINHQAGAQSLVVQDLGMQLIPGTEIVAGRSNP